MCLLSAFSVIPYICFAICRESNNQTDFLKSYSLIDKTLMMKLVMDSAGPLVLNAPSGFGKTWNLEMVKSFLSTTSDETSTNKVFKDTQIMKDEYFVNSHFRRYPVMLCCFKSLGEVTDLASVVTSFCAMLREAYLQHDYLLRSPHLTNQDVQEFQRYTDDKARVDAPYGLYLLSRLLHTHYQTNVILLIDDYDVNIINSIFSKDLDTAEVLRFYCTVLTTAVVYSPYVRVSVLTGTSCVGIRLCADLEHVNCAQFLQDRTVAPLFGLTEAQVDKLFQTQKGVEDRRADVRMWYNGFTSAAYSVSTYNTRSVLSFLASGALLCYWEVARESAALGLLAQEQVARRVFAESRGAVTAEMRVLSRVGLPQLEGLKRMVSAATWDPELTDLYVSLLSDLGYLTFHSRPHNSSAALVKLPNLEVCEAVRQVIAQAETPQHSRIIRPG